MKDGVNRSGIKLCARYVARNGKDLNPSFSQHKDICREIETNPGAVSIGVGRMTSRHSYWIFIPRKKEKKDVGAEEEEE